MRKFYLLVINLFLVLQLSSQEDSLKTVMSNALAEKDYSAYTETAFELFNYHIGQGKTELAIGTLEDAIDNTPKEIDMYYQMKSNYFLQSYILNGNQKPDLHLIDSALISFKHINSNTVNLVNLQIYAGYVYDTHREYAISKDLYSSALSILDSLPENNYNLKLDCHSSIMKYESKFQNYDAALFHARAAIDLIPKADDYSKIIAHYIDNGVLLHSLGLKDDSYNSTIRGWETAQKYGNDFEKAYTNNSMAYMYHEKKEYTLALKYLNESIPYYTSIQNNFELANIELRKADISKERGDTLAWRNIVNKRLEMCRDTYDYHCRALFYKIANDGEGIFSIKQRDSLLAEQIEFSKQSNDYKMVSSSYYARAELAKENKEFETSYQYLIRHMEMEDTSKTIQLQENIAEEKTKQNIETYQYKTQKAELQAQLLTRKNQLFFTILIALASFFLAGIYFYRKLSSSRKKISEQNLQLQQLNDTKDRFFGIIAHDLRSPISALDGVGQQMAYYLKKNDIPKLNLLSERVDLTAKNMSDLLDNLLSWALLQKGMISYNPKSVNVFNAVEENISLFKEVATLKGIELKNLVDESLIVYADSSALATILRNLIHNAVKFTEAGGKVSVDAEKKGDRVFIIINDTGTGIGADAIPKLFDVSHRSRTGTKGEKGTGLGLTLCKEMIELNKGSIRVKSKLGIGTAFIFDLPIPIQT